MPGARLHWRPGQAEEVPHEITGLGVAPRGARAGLVVVCLGELFVVGLIVLDLQKGKWCRQKAGHDLAA